MVKMGMADENIINLDIVGSESFGISIQIGVKNNGRIVFGNYEASMINIMEFCSHKRSSFCKQHGTVVSYLYYTKKLRLCELSRRIVGKTLQALCFWGKIVAIDCQSKEIGSCDS